MLAKNCLTDKSILGDPSQPHARTIVTFVNMKNHPHHLSNCRCLAIIYRHRTFTAENLAPSGRNLDILGSFLWGLELFCTFSVSFHTFCKGMKKHLPRVFFCTFFSVWKNTVFFHTFLVFFCIFGVFFCTAVFFHTFLVFFHTFFKFSKIFGAVVFFCTAAGVFLYYLLGMLGRSL